MTSDTELLPAELQRLLQLFSSLPDVRFPDLDVASLQDAVARVKERHLELMHIEAQQQAVRTALDDEHEALLKKGHRLLAYLKVFAEADEQLAEKVATVSLPRLRRVATQSATSSVSEPSVTPPVDGPKKRGRPRKESATDALFGDAQAAQSA
ncbi:MAG: hypothetical protein DI536_29730 [Archangium gephyra]|uniref:Uncharacterized protein n=1 Tax=Archangium gephyra TaxID=48 RepID=A0A2W5SY59_9BACT|nr:MAG: hypothetical protein DI536_29730 [Archangium gephyra]